MYTAAVLWLIARPVPLTVSQRIVRNGKGHVFVDTNDPHRYSFQLLSRSRPATKASSKCTLRCSKHRSGPCKAMIHLAVSACQLFSLFGPELVSDPVCVG